MRIVSPLLKHVVYPTLARSDLLKHAADRGVAVITYHGVLPQAYESVDPTLDDNLISAETLRRQLRLLKARYQIIAPEDFLSWCSNGLELPPRAMLLTCDDGLRNNLTDMLPILQEEGVRSLFFVTAASAADEPATLWYEDLLSILLAARAGSFKISREGIELCGELRGAGQRRAVWWSAVKRLSQIGAETRRLFVSDARSQLGAGKSTKLAGEDSPCQRRFQLLRRAELMQLAAVGMTIGAHTSTHPMLSQCLPEVARAEIAESRSRLQSLLGRPVWAFAYPFGNAESITPQIVGMAKQAGYEAAFLNFGGGLGTDMRRFAIPRVHVTAAMSLGEFEAHVAGFHALLQRWARRDARNGVLAVQG
jgi:peptidoglycan/xylan/chitin deacetylase (PgdA/CDA1 family)